jgi:hypothetical protein
MVAVLRQTLVAGVDLAENRLGAGLTETRRCWLQNRRGDDFPALKSSQTCSSFVGNAAAAFGGRAHAGRRKARGRNLGGVFDARCLLTKGKKEGKVEGA